MLWRRGGKKEEELATTSLEIEFYLQFPCGFPSTELSDLRQSPFRIDFFDADIQIPETSR